MNKLLALADRVETAHEVETRALLDEAFPLFHAKQMAAKPGFANWNPIWLQFGQFVSVKAFTDAAILLVPEKCLFHVRTLWDGPNAWGYAHVHTYTDDAEDCDGKRHLDDYIGNAATPALALVAASLRARAHGGGEG